MITCILLGTIQIASLSAPLPISPSQQDFSFLGFEDLPGAFHFLLRCMMPKDSENHAAEIHYVKGYPSLAAFIASDCDKSIAIYRRFDRLAARNLLYLQSELVELEARQDALDAEDLRGTLEDKKSARDWQTLRSRAAEPGNTREKERLDLSVEIRKKIKEYRTIHF